MRLHYERKGNGNEFIMLFPGALGSTRTDFLPQLEKFNDKDFTLFAWDPPGYGKSRPPHRPWPTKFFQKDADTAVALMKALNPDKKWNLLGWSDGGITGLIVAGNHPEIVRKLVVWGSNAYVTAQDIMAYEKVRDVNAWSEKMRKPYEDVYGEDYFRTEWSNWCDAISRYFTEFNGDICKDAIHKIECPTLVLHGMKDPMVPNEHPEYLKKEISDCETHYFPEGKHNIHMRYADEFNKVVNNFLLK
ncbi:DgyrCDS4751 [Dimorphilus gyrociliatus]|uniref:DgyrCDS4751 n=1 Tax=Dimorphilus gyrociliatus TaxID=2664684 RepID=A0A7I8VJB6_9ANNE|nr:DgyrCDS4751 [Dimorphilus gyrociliatus]